MTELSTWDASPPVKVGTHVVLELIDDESVNKDGIVYFERDTLPFRYHKDPERTRAADSPRLARPRSSKSIASVMVKLS